MSAEPLETLEIETAPNPRAGIIWMHGLGADGNDFAPLVDEIELPVAVRYIFPHAPMMPVSINGGYVMRAWYDISDSAIRREDEAGVRASQQSVEALIAGEKARGIAADRIVLAGFSQGGAIALQTGLRHGERLAGVMALSTYVPIADKLAAEASPANRNVPIFMAHGTHDAMIPIARAKESRDLLVRQGYAPEWNEYRMEHSVCPQEIAAIGVWLRQLLK
ncbi:MAG: alpha/beta hydrolase fold domain-containing protein [Burkholderiales bacterium]|nr:alpha/beta hydrolase fold domain-containing protein [Burkholderiales bacterium]